MRIRVLPLGIAYIALTTVISAAAANTGNNALYMTAALMLALFVVSGILSVRSLRRLDAERMEGGEMCARSKAPVYIEVRNRAWWPQAGVRINGRACPPIPGGGARRVRLELVFPCRGLHTLPPLHLESRFPFGFLSRWKVLGPFPELLVFPDLGGEGEPPGALRREAGQDERSSRWGEVLDHRGLRRFRDGDDPRHVHWKKSAQRGELVAVEYDHRSRGSFELFLNTRERDPERFEQEVESVAGLCDRLLRKGAPVALATPSARFEAGTGQGHRRRLLAFLALVEREA